MADTEQEDLSQLKGPVTRQRFIEVFIMLFLIVLVCGGGMVICVFGILGKLNRDMDVQVVKWVVTPLAVLVPLVVCTVFWWKRNHLGRTVWWWKNAEGKWRVTAKGYPEKAHGLVIEVHVKARPTSRIMWGPKGWWCENHQFVVGNGYRGFLHNQDGELSAFATWNNIPAGLTKEVIELLCSPNCWRIVPLDAGRVLRLVDALGIGLEFRCTETDADIEGILRSVACFEYRMRQHHSANDLRNERDELRRKCESNWQWLCSWLDDLREQVRTASRPPAKIVALEAMGWILTRLLVELPADHQFRRDYGVNAEELERVRAALTVEKEKGRKPAQTPPAV